MRGLLVLAVFLSGCATLPVKPLKNPHINPRGMPAVIHLVKGEKMRVDELLAADSEGLWVAVHGKKVRIPTDNISKIDIIVSAKNFSESKDFWLVFTPLMLGLSLAPLVYFYYLTMSPDILFCLLPFFELGIAGTTCVGCVGYISESEHFISISVDNPLAELRTLQAYCRYPQGMPTYFYVKGDSLYVFSPLRGELTYEVYSEDGEMIASAEVGRVSPGLNSFALIEKGEVKVYLNGGRVRELPVPPEESEHIPPYSRYKLEFKKDALTIRVFEGSVWVRYRILTEDGKPVRERELGLLEKGIHLYRLDLLELEYGTYILEVRVGDEVRKYRVKVEER